MRFLPIFRRFQPLSFLASTPCRTKIVPMDSFCTNLRTPNCSHTPSMLRICRLATPQNSLIISDFEWMGGICPFEWMVGGQAKENRSDGLFLHQSADNEMLIYAQVNSAFVTLLCTKIASSPPILKGGESALLRI